jgi:hypothetical protein
MLAKRLQRTAQKPFRDVFVVTRDDHRDRDVCSVEVRRGTLLAH